MQSCSDWLDLNVSIIELDHIGMWTTCIGPAEWEGFFVIGSSLEHEFVLGVEEENAEGSMRHGVWFRQVFVGMSCPLVDTSQEAVSIWDRDEVVEENFVRKVFCHLFNNIINLNYSLRWKFKVEEFIIFYFGDKKCRQHLMRKYLIYLAKISTSQSHQTLPFSKKVTKSSTSTWVYLLSTENRLSFICWAKKLPS